MYCAKKKAAVEASAPTAQKIAALPGREGARPEEGGSSLGAGARSCHQPKAVSRRAAGQGAEHLGALPAGDVAAAAEPPDEAEHAAAHEPDAGQVDPLVGTVGSPASASARAAPAPGRSGR